MRSVMDNDFVSKRQAVLKYGFNAKTFDAMIEAGLLKVRVKEGRRPSVWVSVESLEGLQEGRHFVICQECGAYQSQITPKHLSACSGLGYDAYQTKHPSARLMSSFVSERKAKTDEEKQHQSRVLKARFLTPGGMITRESIANASRRLMSTEYREKASAHLRALSQSPGESARRKQRSLEMWQNPSHKEKVQEWHKTHKSLSLRLAAEARSHITRTFSGLHRLFKEGLVRRGITGFQTEYRVGYYHVDEAHPDLKLAVEVDGCYWHGCTTCGFVPRSGMAALDKRKNSYLTRLGWIVLRFAEHEIHSDFESCLDRVAEAVGVRDVG